MKPIKGGVDTVKHCNEYVDHKAKDITKGGKPKMATDGKDISKNATNSLGKFRNKMLSPNSQAASIAK